MQELIERINNEEFDHLDDCKMFIQEHMLEKEKEVLMRAYQDGLDNGSANGNWVLDFWYNETFNTKEK